VPTRTCTVTSKCCSMLFPSLSCVNALTACLPTTCPISLPNDSVHVARLRRTSPMAGAGRVPRALPAPAPGTSLCA